MCWIPTNYRNSSSNKDRGDEAVYKYKKRKKSSEKGLANSIKEFKIIKKLK